MMIIPLPIRGATGAGGGVGKCPPMIFVFVSFWLLAQRSVMAMIVPLPHY